MKTRPLKKPVRKKAKKKAAKRVRQRAVVAPVSAVAAPPPPAPTREKDPADERPPRPTARWAISRKLTRFIVHLQHHGNVTRALRTSKLDRGYAYDRRATDQEFAAAWAEAVKTGLEVLKDEAWRRAHEGVSEPKFHAGKIVGHVQRYSDSLLMFLIKQADPSFREHFDLTLANAGGRPFLFAMQLHQGAVQQVKDGSSS